MSVYVWLCSHNDVGLWQAFVNIGANVFLPYTKVPWWFLHPFFLTYSKQSLMNSQCKNDYRLHDCWWWYPLVPLISFYLSVNIIHISYDWPFVMVMRTITITTEELGSTNDSYQSWKQYYTGTNQSAKLGWSESYLTSERQTGNIWTIWV